MMSPETRAALVRAGKLSGRYPMADDRERSDAPDDAAAADDRAAAAEAAEVERDDNLVNEEAALDEVSIPPQAAIDQPDPIPPDGIG
jgi:hypothetical protein